MSRVILTALVISCAAAAQPLQPLFDGKSLAGWTVRNGTASYVVDQGSILGTTAEGSPNSFLSPPREYGDFILEFEVLVDPRMNSGVQIRSHEYAQETETWINNGGRRQRTFPAGRVHGYQVEISTAEKGDSGGIFDEARRGWIDDNRDDPAALKAFRDNQWNHYRVEAVGDSIRVWVNGIPCADLVDPTDLSGFLGFQVHSFQGAPPATVRWRNVRIADLGRHSWRALFNGKNLDGWSRRGSGEAAVVDGAIRLIAKQGSGPGFVVTDQTFDDVTLRLEYKAIAGNSGVFFRAIDLGIEKIQGPRGYEVDIAPQETAGGLQEPGRRPWVVQPTAEQMAQYYKPGEWNQLVVSTHGDRIVVHVNGTKTVDLTEDQGRRRGRIALQINPGRADVEMYYRRIEILAKQ